MPKGEDAMTSCNWFKSLVGTYARVGARGRITALLAVVAGTAALAVVVVAVLVPFRGIARAVIPTQVVRIAGLGDEAPGTGGGVFMGGSCQSWNSVTFDEPMVNNGGDVAFHACFTGGSEPAGFGAFLKRNGAPVELIARTDEFISGVGTLGSDAESFDGPKINNKGTVVFVNRDISGPARAAVLQKKIGSPLAAILKEGDPVPGLSGFSFWSFDDMDQNNKDDVAIIATYTNNGGATLHSGVFLIQNDGKVVLILLDGAALPGIGGGNFNGTHLYDVDGPWLNDSRVVVFAVDSISGGSCPSTEEPDCEGSVFARRPGKPIELFVKMGEVLPASFKGGRVEGIGLGRPAFNNSNTLGFNLNRNSGTPETFLVTKKLGGGIKKCVADLTPAPGLAPPATFDGFSQPTINNRGYLQFSADVGGDPVNNRGIFVCDPRGKATAVVLRGDPKPGGGAWSFELEEGSISDNFAVFLDEKGTSAGNSVGVFRATIPTW